jgi:hypothetical protein
VSVEAGTDCGTTSPDRARDGHSAPPSEAPVSTRLVGSEAEPFPYTKIRDWIALLPVSKLSDGAFRLYCLSRSVIWENSKGGAPTRPVVEITYEEYAMILGRSARTIARFAHELYSVGLWQVIERAHRSVVVPGKARPEVRTVITVRVHDFPIEPATFAGAVKTWDVLAAIRDTKRTATVSGPTAVSAQSDQRERVPPGAGTCATTDLSSQSPTPPAQDRPQGLSPAVTPETPGGCDTTTVTVGKTDLSARADVRAGHTARGRVPKKKDEEEKPSLPPTPSTDHDHPGGSRENHTPSSSLSDELAMFSSDAVGLVAQLYDRSLSAPGLQALSAGDRVGLARRIDGRLAEGWSLSRVRAVLTGGSLVGVKVPGRLWMTRLDDMPSRPLVPAPRPAPDDTSSPDRGSRPRPSMVTNDCSALPDPNPGKVRYQVPDDRGVRLMARWADERQVRPWCGRCSSESRTLAPRESGRLPRPCLDCHPEPHAFPTDAESAPRPAVLDPPRSPVPADPHPSREEGIPLP